MINRSLFARLMKPDSRLLLIFLLVGMFAYLFIDSRGSNTVPLLPYQELEKEGVKEAFIHPSSEREMNEVLMYDKAGNKAVMNSCNRLTLKTGDLLVRPNLNWLPGTSKVASGRNFGHVVIVIRGAEGTSIEETLRQSIVAEAFIFDQKSRSFVFDSKKQVRIVPADVSFGKRFEGIRYRLRMDLNENQQKMMSQFLNSQIGIGGYSIFSTKNDFIQSSASENVSFDAGQKTWNCATLAWFAYKQIAGIDVDSNQGFWVYPNDIILSESFNGLEGRLRF